MACLYTELQPVKALFVPACFMCQAVNSEVSLSKTACTEMQGKERKGHYFPRKLYFTLYWPCLKVVGVLGWNQKLLSSLWQSPSVVEGTNQSRGCGDFGWLSPSVVKTETNGDSFCLRLLSSGSYHQTYAASDAEWGDFLWGKLLLTHLVGNRRGRKQWKGGWGIALKLMRGEWKRNPKTGSVLRLPEGGSAGPAAAQQLAHVLLTGKKS